MKNVAVGLLCLFSLPARAEGLIAAFAGPAIVVSGAGQGEHYLGLGGRVGFSLYEDGRVGVGSLGVVVNTLSDSVTIESVTAKMAVTFIGLEFVGRKQFGTGFYWGVRAGLGLSSAEASSDTAHLRISQVDFASAPVVGYESALGNSGAILFLDASWVMIWSGRGEHQNPSALLLLAGLGFAF